MPAAPQQLQVQASSKSPQNAAEKQKVRTRAAENVVLPGPTQHCYGSLCSVAESLCARARLLTAVELRRSG